MSSFGPEVEWAALFLFCALGTSLFDAFEVGIVWWRKFARWVFAAFLTFLAYFFVGHWSLVVLVSLALAGVMAHFWWCYKNGIHPLRAEPRAKYRSLRGWRTGKSERLT